MLGQDTEDSCCCCCHYHGPDRPLAGAPLAPHPSANWRVPAGGRGGSDPFHGPWPSPCGRRHHRCGAGAGEPTGVAGGRGEVHRWVVERYICRCRHGGRWMYIWRWVHGYVPAYIFRSTPPQPSEPLPPAAWPSPLPPGSGVPAPAWRAAPVSRQLASPAARGPEPLHGAWIPANWQVLRPRTLPRRGSRQLASSSRGFGTQAMVPGGSRVLLPFPVIRNSLTIDIAADTEPIPTAAILVQSAIRGAMDPRQLASARPRPPEPPPSPANWPSRGVTGVPLRSFHLWSPPTTRGPWSPVNWPGPRPRHRAPGSSPEPRPQAQPGPWPRPPRRPLTARGQLWTLSRPPARPPKPSRPTGGPRAPGR